MMMATVTAIQFAHARVLAEAFGHEWGVACGAKCDSTTAQVDAMKRLVYEVLVDEVHVGTIADVSRSMAFAAEDDDEQILAPKVDEDGDVVHTTSNGRLGWRVHRDGMVDLHVYAPLFDDEGHVGPASVLDVQVTPDNHLSARFDKRHARIRHVEAAELALRALDVPAEVTRSMFDFVPDGQEFVAARASFEEASAAGMLN